MLPQRGVERLDRHHPEVEPVAAPHHLDGLQGLGEVVAGVDEHHLDRRFDPGGDVDEDGVGHRGAEAQVGVEGVDRPAHDGGGRLLLEPLVELGQRVVGQLRCGDLGHAHVAHSEAPISFA